MINLIDLENLTGRISKMELPNLKQTLTWLKEQKPKSVIGMFAKKNVIEKLEAEISVKELFKARELRDSCTCHSPNAGTETTERLIKFYEASKSDIAKQLILKRYEMCSSCPMRVKCKDPRKAPRKYDWKPIWIRRSGKAILIEDMHTEHIKRAIDKLYKENKHLRFRMALDYLKAELSRRKPEVKILDTASLITMIDFMLARNINSAVGQRVIDNALKEYHERKVKCLFCKNTFEDKYDNCKKKQKVEVL